MGLFDYNAATEFEFNWETGLLLNVRSSEYFHIYGGTDHVNDSPSDDFCLKSRLFMSDGRGKNAGQVKYFELLLNGALNLYVCEPLRKIAIKYPKHSYVESIAEAKPELFEIDKIIKEEFYKTEHLARIAIFALADEKVSHIVQVASLGNSFVNLSKILETILGDESAKENGFLLTTEEKKKKNSFTYTANSPAVIGIYARHGLNGKGESAKPEKPNKTEAMELSEAHSFVKSVFLRYMDFKCQSCPNWI